MIIILNLVIGLFLTILSTIYLPSLNLIQNFYDLNLSLIICAALFGKKKDGFIIAIILGLMMDNLSGGPFGIYLLSYIWMIILTEIISLYLQKDSLLIIFITSSIGVIIQNSFIFYSVYFISEGRLFFTGISTYVSKQIFYALCLSPFLIFLIKLVLIRFSGFNRKFQKI